ncbi:hypothetical protein [Streptomyces phaeochromogenes]|uniref:hypothetical protein n=1 Tax=Streptomyces phaeochromogenes TaxID=1923 RepID=UPI002DDABB5E|nr:hypothetical protein [Streptomyces phaeochromogenes]WRZ30212.1 hypothetical protein OG931_21905 [Streptomyces phaeochromogenes]
MSAPTSPGSQLGAIIRAFTRLATDVRRIADSRQSDFVLSTDGPDFTNPHTDIEHEGQDVDEQQRRLIQDIEQQGTPAAQTDNGLTPEFRKKFEDLQARQQQAAKKRDDRAWGHIKAVIEVLKEETDTPTSAVPQVFISGMLTGLASSVEILDGGTAEKALESVNTRLAAAIGEAYLAGNLPPQPPQPSAEQGAPVDWEAIARRREAELKTAGERTQAVEQERDGAYRERAHLVALLAAMTEDAVIAPAPDVDEPGWQIVYLIIGSSQASWHISPLDGELFECVEHVPMEDPRARWDGHSTDDKYARIRQHTRLLFRQCGPACAEGHTYTGRCEGAPTVDDSIKPTPDLVHSESKPQTSEPARVDEPCVQHPNAPVIGGMCGGCTQYPGDLTRTEV